MPQIDPEALSGGGNDGKIDSGTAPEGAAAAENDAIRGDYDAADLDPDFPPESFWLSKDAEYDWFDRNALYERKDSGKGNSNSTNANPSINPNSNPNTHRFSVSLKSKPSVIGLPKTQKAAFVDPMRRTCKPANIRLFPKRSESAGKSTVPVAEPGSPKVSCMGRVRSKRCRRRSNSLKRKEKTVEKLRSDDEKKKTGFYSKVMRMFGSKKGHKKAARSGSRKSVEEKPMVVEPQRKSVSLNVPVGGETVAEPPALGGLNRFASGRRSGCWAAEDFK
ncbi:Calcium/calmodulin-dependent protein kinase [Handroanthus impetiginosus]|uniref:Calcium/calmodulin-dependent protein kinase n=1 Tax=Handroanthus impetiginosus TaxID=429701 RepID=A0A2G9GPP7_9LAMI|nr:Calcium/calmodulin-dependent protein kinase [Handroanthus impetiginosus]